jgi:RNA polymerase sigma factor for flagellar operon FliA
MQDEDEPSEPALVAAPAVDRRGRRGEGPIEKLLVRYRNRRNVALRNQIVERCRPVVEAMARTMALRLPRCVDPQDLVHAGMWGLMQAIDKYRHERCDQFLAFMRIRARGAMLDELRGMDFLPRHHRRRLRQREDAMRRLRLELSREPCDTEVAAELGVSLRALQQTSADGVLVGTPAENRDGEDLPDAMDRLADGSVESPIEAILRQELLVKIRQSLRPMEWKVLQMHYLEGLTGKEVARRLRLSASRICQIHLRVMDRLKERMASVAV